MSFRLPPCPLWLAGRPVDFRKSIDGLVGEVTSSLGKSPQEDIVIFYNRARNRLKILCWDGSGFVLIYKRLERGRFVLPKGIEQAIYFIDEKEFDWLMQGIDWWGMRQSKEINYHNFY